MNTMKEVISLLLVLNFVFSSAVCIGRRLKRSAGEESNSSLNSSGETAINFFAQKLDHFNPVDTRKWNQRYWINTKYFEKGGPALLIANGAWSLDDDGKLENEEVVESFAKELKAVIFSLELRFYGKSWPTKEYIRYLSVRQAVTDIASFIKGVTETSKLPKDTKWIVIGCSYGGMLTTWARLKFPHLIHGAVVSSAPILAKLDIYDYHRAVDESLNSYDPKCGESIKMVIDEVSHFINSTENIQNILPMLYICDDKIKNAAELATILYNSLVNILSASVQGNDDTIPPFNISGICKLMMNNTSTKLERFIEVRKWSVKYQNMDEYSYEEKLWDYQRCSELGDFSSYYSKSSLFALSQMIPIESDVKKICGQFFGPNFGAKELKEKVSQTNFLYGGLDINIGNMVFTHGSLDPWYTSGIYQKKDGALYETILINGTSHCSDLFYSDTDPPQLKNARIKVLNLMKDWLQK